MKNFSDRIRCILSSFGVEKNDPNVWTVEVEGAPEALVFPNEETAREAAGKIEEEVGIKVLKVEERPFDPEAVKPIPVEEDGVRTANFGSGMLAKLVAAGVLACVMGTTALGAQANGAKSLRRQEMDVKKAVLMVESESMTMDQAVKMFKLSEDDAKEVQQQVNIGRHNMKLTKTDIVRKNGKEVGRTVTQKTYKDGKVVDSNVRGGGAGSAKSSGGGFISRGATTDYDAW